MNDLHVDPGLAQVKPLREAVGKVAVRTAATQQDNDWRLGRPLTRELGLELSRKVPYFAKAVPASNSTFAVFPTSDAEFAKIFETSASKGNSVQLASELELLQSVSNITFAKPTDGFQEFQKFLDNSSTAYVTVIGHNNDGNFRFLRGGDIHLTAMAEACNAAQKRCIFLSCRSELFGVGGNEGENVGIRSDITFGDAALIADALNRQLFNDSEKKASFFNISDQLPSVISALEFSAKTARTARTTIIPVVGVGSVPLIIVLVNDK
ncbi:hypothetical protein [Mesorhizobium sp.]|uniref:hypothetical protein n=1 Tax=Mesorhizobium sp. TaxID=1871066 RepID=UPI000FE98E83|nr:hypothetical protein [Mesorhizobium sp.]RWA68843.1 MAG: hypothetical protein EOQ29_18715 [Mesorhizobium sp.]